MKPRKEPRQARANDVDAAIAYARDFLIELGESGELCNDYRRSRTPFDYKMQLAPLVWGSDEFIYPLRWNEKAMRKIVEQARRGDATAARALRQSAAELLRRRHPLPESLNAWLSEHLNDDWLVKRSRRGPKPDELRTRDRGLSLVIRTMTKEPWGFAPTRNRATKAESACSIVHRALAGLPGFNLSESGLEKIWERHRHKR
jgi:hypothetical protein